MRLYNAVINGDVECFKELIENMDIDQLQNVDYFGNNPAHIACKLNKPYILKALHEKGVDLSKPCDTVSFGSPIFYALQYQNVSILNLLWELGYDISGSCDKFGNSALYHAELKGDTVITESINEICKRGTYHDEKATKVQALVRRFLVRNGNKDSKDV